MALLQRMRSTFALKHILKTRTFTSVGTEPEATEMQSPLFAAPELPKKEDAASYGSSIRDQTNSYVQEVIHLYFHWTQEQQCDINQSCPMRDLHITPCAC